MRDRCCLDGDVALNQAQVDLTVYRWSRGCCQHACRRWWHSVLARSRRWAKALGKAGSLIGIGPWSISDRQVLRVSMVEEQCALAYMHYMDMYRTRTKVGR